MPVKNLLGVTEGSIEKEFMIQPENFLGGCSTDYYLTNSFYVVIEAENSIKFTFRRFNSLMEGFIAAQRKVGG